MADDNGQIVSFYSYKGGTGRTMTLANIAWILASNGKRVLAVDWDLESPGLHKYFGPFLDHSVPHATPGMIELIADYSEAAKKGHHRAADWQTKYASILTRAVSLDWQFPARGTLDFLPAGLRRKYLPADWDEFYWMHGGVDVISELCADMRRNYDYVLVDSQVGLSDLVETCTERIPDALVACFTLSDQSIEGIASVARVNGLQPAYGGRQVRILPVPMRVDNTHPDRLEERREVARRMLTGFPNGFDDEGKDAYWDRAGIPYKAEYAYEETLAVFGDVPNSPTSLLAAFERLTGSITEGTVTSLPSMPEEARLSYQKSRL